MPQVLLLFLGSTGCQPVALAAVLNALLRNAQNPFVFLG